MTFTKLFLPFAVAVLMVSTVFGYPIQEYYDHHPEYKFEYSVHDPHTHDFKSQKESRHGDLVKGYYQLKEADGSLREVHYTADKHSGFNAKVTRNGQPLYEEGGQQQSGGYGGLGGSSSQNFNQQQFGGIGGSSSQNIYQQQYGGYGGIGGSSSQNFNQQQYGGYGGIGGSSSQNFNQQQYGGIGGSSSQNIYQQQYGGYGGIGGSSSQNFNQQQYGGYGGIGGSS